MAVKIQVRRGSRAGLPALAPGEYGLTTDTKELFIGGPDGNLQVPVLGSDGKVPAGQLPDMNYDPAGTAATEAGKVQTNLTSHINNKSNPHSVTAAQVGADPAGTAETKANAVQANLTSHTNNKSNPHGVTKAQVGLGNVDNTSDANKPISTATQTALNGKANTSHTHAAGDITSGTLPASRGGTGYTSLSSLMSAINNRSTNVSSANTSYTTLMARGAKLVSSDTSPGVNGAISWTYG